MSDFLPDLDPSDSPLSADAKRNLIRSTISYFTSRDISASSALESYRSAGLGIRESDFFKIYREVQGINLRANRINSVNLDRIPTDAVFEPRQFAQKQRYMFNVAAFIYDSDTGDKRQEVRTIYRSSLDTMRNMRSDFQGYFDEYPAFGESEVGEVHILGAYIDEELF